MHQPVVAVGTKHCHPVDAVDTKGCCYNTYFWHVHWLVYLQHRINKGNKGVADYLSELGWHLLVNCALYVNNPGMGGITVLFHHCLATLWLMMAWTLQELSHYETCYWFGSAQAVWSGYYINLFWWNYKRIGSANWPLEFRITPIDKWEGNHTYWDLKI